MQDSAEHALPTYLNTPPQTLVDPPIVTREQELPFGKLAWENFERLCLRIVRDEAEVLHCQLYGKTGQKQHGIDFYAKLRTEHEYRVYQCKRENAFGPAKVKKAVTKFLSGIWAGKAQSLVLCTKESLISSDRANELELQRQRLANHGVNLLVWDSTQLSLHLKKHPDLVDDFFGRPWVAAFLGEEVAQQLGCRLDGADIASLRKSLGAFYTRVFAQHDPGLPISGSESVLVLPDRYVIPDVLEPRPHTSSAGDSPEQQGNPSTVDSRELEFEQQEAPRSSLTGMLGDIPRERTRISSWLARSTNSLVLGEPGSGKSSLLRFICIDLLQSDPKLNDMANRWGSYLPIWVPFPLWTRVISNQGQEALSLSELLKLWLRSWDEERLWPLVERALRDERLLLLIDGLDEWSHDAAARIAIQRLQVFIAQRQIPSIAASRPQGLNRLAIRLTGWMIGELAGLTAGQQRQVAMAWFMSYEKNLAAGKSDSSGVVQRARRRADVFFGELTKSRDLSHLAQNPLLLTLLVYHWLHHGGLPHTRFRAYESLVDHLISIHPQRRRAAASATESSGQLSEEDIKQVLSYVAFQFQTVAGTGTVPLEETNRWIQTFLSDADRGLGLEQADAHRLARWVTDVGEVSLGLLVHQSPSDIGFVHRVFQEFLAALYISRMPLIEQQKLLRARCRNPQWREVLLAFLYCNKRPADVDGLLQILRELRDNANPADRLAIESLLCETALGDFSCSVRFARDVAREIFDVVETGTRMPHRERLLIQVLGGLSSTKVRDFVRDKIDHWFPCWFSWRGPEYEAMGAWPDEPETIQTLWRGLFDEETHNKIGAARGLARIGRNNETLGSRIRSLAQTAEDPVTRVMALYAVAQGWPDLQGIDALIQVGDCSNSPTLQFGTIWARNILGISRDADLTRLLSLASPRSELDHTLGREIPGLLLNGWRGNMGLKKECLRAVATPPSPKLTLDYDVAWPVLLSGFPQDDDVAEQVVRSLGQPVVFAGLLAHDIGWRLLAENFQNHPSLIAPLDEWIEGPHLENEVAYAALVGRTETAKRKLLSLLAPGHFGHWPAFALAKGWGMADPDVARAFSDIISSPPSNACRFAWVLPLVIADRAECRDILMRLLGNPECKRPDLVLAGLRDLPGTWNASEVVDRVLANEAGRTDLFWMNRDQFVYVLIDGFHRDPRVRLMAKDSFSSESPPYSAIARAYPDDPELRDMLRRRLSPLPTRLRLLIAAHLAEGCADSTYATSTLSLYRAERDAEVKCQASVAYWDLLNRRNEVTPEMRDQLARDVVCYGPDHDAERQAAFCGLATLDRLDLMLNARETIGAERICAISLRSNFTGTNTPLLRFIVKEWDKIRTTFGTDTCKRLNDRSGDWASFWDQMSSYADGNSSVKDELLSYLQSRSERTASPNLLRFLARTRPKSQLLLEYCLGTLRVGNDGLDIVGPLGEVASLLLGEYFRGDESTVERILSGKAGQCLYGRTILALSEGWPDHPYLKKAYETVSKSWRQRLDPIWHRLACRHGSALRVKRELRRICRARPIELRQNWFSIRPFIQRLGRDDELTAMVIEILTKHPTPAEKSSLAKLLSLARGTDESLRRWCQQELHRQTNELPAPEVGLDAVLKNERSIIQSLIDSMVGGAEPIGIDE